MNTSPPSIDRPIIRSEWRTIVRWYSVLLALAILVIGRPGHTQNFRIGEPESDVRTALQIRFGSLDTAKAVKMMHINDGSNLYNFGPYQFYGMEGRAGVVIDSGVVSAFTWATGVNTAAVPMADFTKMFHAIGTTFGPPSTKSTLEPQRVVRGWRTDSTHANLTLDHGHLQFTVLKNEVIQPAAEKPKE